MQSVLVWLRDRHVADVCAAGADDAELVVLDEVEGQQQHVLEMRYRFGSRGAFQRYEREQAPRLRAEGLAEIARLGIVATMTRTTGELVAWHRRS
jgi:hypothetical protein